MEDLVQRGIQCTIQRFCLLTSSQSSFDSCPACQSRRPRNENEEAYDGAEGIRLLEKKQDEYDIVLLDLIMPNKDGITVLE